MNCVFLGIFIIIYCIDIYIWYVYLRWSPGWPKLALHAIHRDCCQPLPNRWIFQASFGHAAPVTNITRSPRRCPMPLIEWLLGQTNVVPQGFERPLKDKLQHRIDMQKSCWICCVPKMEHCFDEIKRSFYNITVDQSDFCRWFLGDWCWPGCPALLGRESL